MMRLLRSLVPFKFKHLYKWYTRPTYREEICREKEITRLQSMPRYQPTETTLLGRTVWLVDAASFLSAYQSIFLREIYRFVARRNDPRILDCGANIGLAIFYWKKLYPDAQITGFEPDPVVFQALERNCSEWQLSGVRLENKAIWNTMTELPFKVEGADAGHLLSKLTSGAESIVTVRTVRLRDYLNDPVDFLKLDIEGAEVEVLLDCADRLMEIDHLFVEYHSFVDQEQRVDEILRVLRTVGFRLHIQPELVLSQPFMKRYTYAGMDQRLNIFGYRNRT